MEKNIYCANWYSPLGWISVTASDIAIKSITFAELHLGDEQINPLLINCLTQLQEYFAGNRVTFDLPLAPEGTDFQKKVWSKLSTVGYGEKLTYGELAYRISCSKSARAVGSALGKNPIAIVVPCHRIVNKSEKATMKYRYGSDKKAYLLELEKTKAPS